MAAFRFSPGCDCCGGGDAPTGCCNCEVIPAQWTLTVAGVVNGGADGGCDDCDGYNGTFTLDYVSGPDESGHCTWETEETELCDEPSSRPLYTLTCENPGGGPTFFWVLTVGIDGSLVSFDRWTSGSNPVACLEGVDLERDTSGNNGPCIFDPSAFGFTTMRLDPVL